MHIQEFQSDPRLSYKRYYHIIHERRGIGEIIAYDSDLQFVLNDVSEPMQTNAFFSAVNNIRLSLQSRLADKKTGKESIVASLSGPISAGADNFFQTSINMGETKYSSDLIRNIFALATDQQLPFIRIDSKYWGISAEYNACILTCQADMIPEAALFLQILSPHLLQADECSKIAEQAFSKMNLPSPQ